MQLDDTDKLVLERAQHYGAPEDNFERIRLGWQAIFGVDVSLVQVALAMDWVKTSRLIESPGHADSWADKLGYTRIGERLSHAAGGDRLDSVAPK
jgi:hypothetical protein